MSIKFMRGCWFLVRSGQPPARFDNWQTALAAKVAAKIAARVRP